MSTPVSGPSVGRSQETLRSFVDLALKEVVTAVGAKYFKVPVVFGTAAKAAFEAITASATQLAEENPRATKPSRQGIARGAAELAAAILLDSKGQGDNALRDAFRNMVHTVVGDPPTVDDPAKATVTKRPNTNNSGQATFQEGHIFWSLCERLGLKEPRFGANGKAFLNSTEKTLLSDKTAYQDFATKLSEAVLKDGKELAKSLVNKLVSFELIAPTASGRSNGRSVAPEGPVPTGTIEGEASHARPRDSADTTPMLTMVRNLASSTAAQQAKRNKREQAAVGAEIKAPEAIVRHIGDALGVPQDHPGFAVATKIVESTFSPLDAKENPDKFDALEAILGALIKTAKGRLKDADAKVGKAKRLKNQEGLNRAIANREVVKNELASLESKLRSTESIRYELTEAGGSQNFDRAVGFLIAQGLGKLVGDALELPPSQRAGLDRLDTLDAIHKGLFEEKDRTKRTGLQRLKDRLSEAVVEKEGAPAPFQLPNSLIDLVDPNSGAKTADKVLKEMFPQLGGNPQAAELKDRYAAMLSGIIDKHKPQTNIDLITRVAEALTGMGVSNEAASILTAYAVGVQGECEHKLKSAHDALQMGRKTIETNKARLATMEGELAKKISQRDDLKKNLPTDPARKAALEKTTGELSKTIAEWEQQIEKLRKDVTEGRKGIGTLLKEVKRLYEDFTTQMDGVTGASLHLLLEGLQDPQGVEQALMAHKPMLEERGFLPKGDTPDTGDTADNGNKPPKDPRDPGNKPPGGDDNDFGSGSRRPIRGEPTPLQLRAIECARVLADPCLSIQDKVFYFMMIFAKWSDKEREDKLREFTAQEEAAAKEDAHRQNLSSIQDARVEDLRNANKELNGVCKELEKLEPLVKDGKLSAEDPKYKELTEQKGTLTTRVENLDTGIQNAAKELNEAASNAQKSPRARELIFSEIDRITKFRDQMINMARSIIDDANRLIERIFR